MAHLPRLIIASWKELKKLHKWCVKNDYLEIITISDIVIIYDRVPFNDGCEFTIKNYMLFCLHLLNDSENNHYDQNVFNQELATKQLSLIAKARYQQENCLIRGIPFEEACDFVISKVSNEPLFAKHIPLTKLSIYNIWLRNILYLIENGLEENDDFGFTAMACFPSMNVILEYKKTFCGNCGNYQCKLKCSKCKKQKYCNETCQKKDWKIHKQTCVKSCNLDEVD